MRIAGGVVALIAGIFGLIAAIATLFLGGVGTVFSADGADSVLRFGWGGIAFSFLVIVYGACILGSKGRWASYLLIVSAIGGWFLGGLLVGICMVLALIGGVLSLFQARSEAERAKQSRVAIVLAILPLLVVAALSAESIYEAKNVVASQESVEEAKAPAATDQAAPSRANSAVASDGSSGVSCKSIPTTLWSSIQGSGAISRGVTDCEDVTIVSHGDIDGDGAPDVVAVWDSESSCADLPEEPSGSCGNNVAQFVSAQLGSGVEIKASRLKGEATSATVSPGSLDIYMLGYGPNDPHCCPSVKEVEHFVLQGNALVNANSTGEDSAKEPVASEGDKSVKKCALIANTANQAAQIRFDPDATNEEKMMLLMRGGASADLAGALLSFVTVRPADSAELLKRVVMDDCLKGDLEAIDHDPRLHSISH